MLNDAGIPAGPVRNLREVLTDEQLLTREMVHVLQHSSAGPVQVLGPCQAVRNAWRRRRPPPALGNTPKKSSLETWGLPHRRSTSCGRLALSDANHPQLGFTGARFWVAQVPFSDSPVPVSWVHREPEREP